MSEVQVLTVDIANQFVEDKNSVEINKYTKIEDDAATILSRFDGWLDLSGLTKLSDAAALALSNHRGDLSLSGLRNLSDVAAVALGNHQGDLSLSGLTSLSDAAAEALNKHQGPLDFENLRFLSPTTIERLHESKLDLGFIDLENISAMRKVVVTIERIMIVITKTCRNCGETHSVNVPDEAFQAWQAGELIQDAMPDVPNREILISGICGPCFQKMYPDDAKPGDEEDPMENR